MSASYIGSDLILHNDYLFMRIGCKQCIIPERPKILTHILKQTDSSNPHLPNSCGNSWQKTARDVPTPITQVLLKAAPIANPSPRLCRISPRNIIMLMLFIPALTDFIVSICFFEVFCPWTNVKQSLKLNEKFLLMKPLQLEYPLIEAAKTYVAT